MFYLKNQFTSFPFSSPHTKLHGVRGLIKHCHIIFDTKLGHRICALPRIPFSCDECKYMLKTTWINGLSPQNNRAINLSYIEPTGQL